MCKMSVQFGFRLAADGLKYFGTRHLPPLFMGSAMRISTCLEVFYDLFPFFKENSFSLIVSIYRKEIVLIKDGGHYQSFPFSCHIPTALSAVEKALSSHLALLGCETGDFTVFWDCLLDSFHQQEVFQE